MRTEIWSKSIDANNDTTEVSYYQNMPVVEPDVNSNIISGTFPGTYVVRNKHLIKSVFNTDPSRATNFSYTLDSSGRVLTQTEDGGGTITTFTYAHIPISKN